MRLSLLLPNTTTCGQHTCCLSVTCTQTHTHSHPGTRISSLLQLKNSYSKAVTTDAHPVLQTHTLRNIYIPRVHHEVDPLHCRAANGDTTSKNTPALCSHSDVHLCCRWKLCLKLNVTTNTQIYHTKVFFWTTLLGFLLKRERCSLQFTEKCFMWSKGKKLNAYSTPESPLKKHENKQSSRMF